MNILVPAHTAVNHSEISLSRFLERPTRITDDPIDREPRSPFDGCGNEEFPGKSQTLYIGISHHIINGKWKESGIFSIMFKILRSLLR